MNSIHLLGRLVRPPVLKPIGGGTVCSFSLAANRRWRDRDGNRKEDVLYIDCDAFGRVAEVINEFVGQGDPLLIEGRLKLNSWTSQDGQKRSKHTIVVERFDFVAPRGSDQPAPDRQPTSDRQPAPAQSAPSESALDGAIPF